jgi:hypothetical protein
MIPSTIGIICMILVYDTTTHYDQPYGVVLVILSFYLFFQEIQEESRVAFLFKPKYFYVC